MNRFILLLITLFILSVSSVHAATFTSTSNGDWDLGTTWGGACDQNCIEGVDYPGSNDTANIQNDSTVSVPVDQTVNNINITAGILDFPTNSNAQHLTILGNLNISDTGSISGYDQTQTLEIRGDLIKTAVSYSEFDGIIKLSASSPGKLISFKNFYGGTMVFDGADGSWSLTSDLIDWYGALSVLNGNLLLNGHNLRGYYNNIDINGGTLTGDSNSSITLDDGNCDVTGNLTIESGVFIAPHTVTICNGQYSHSGGSVDWLINTSTVNITSTGSTIIDANDTFYNLNLYDTYNTSFDLRFVNGKTITVNGSFGAHGFSDDSTLNLISNSDGDQWSVNAKGSRDISYVKVKDSNNVSSTIISCSSCSDLGGNTGWNIVRNPILSTISTLAASSTKYSSITFNGEIVNTGYQNADERGFVWGTSSAYGATTTESGNFGTGIFSTSTPTICNTTYYFRAYSHNSAGYSYGLEESIKTDICPKPDFADLEATYRFGTSVTLNGRVITANGNISEKGFVWGSDVDHMSTTTVLGDFSTSTFSTTVSGILPNTTYYFQTYVVVSTYGLIYGPLKTFSISSLPTVNTAGFIYSSSQSLVMLKGSVVSSASTVTERGFEYGLTNKYGATTTESGSFSTGMFYAITPRLTAGTTYHYRTYAINSSGINYSDDYTFYTSPLFSYTTFGDSVSENQSPTDIAINTLGHSYVAVTGNNVMSEFDQHGNYIESWGSYNHDLNYRFNFSADEISLHFRHNNLYISGGSDQSFLIFDSNKNFLQEVYTGQNNNPLPYVVGISTDYSGNIYIGTQQSIIRFNSAGSYLSQWNVSPRFYNLSIDSFDNIYVADSFSNTIKKYDTAGNLLLEWGGSWHGGQSIHWSV